VEDHQKGGKLTGKISPKNELIEGWMEIKSHYANNRKDNESLKKDLLRNREMDLKNDALQEEGMKHLEHINYCLNVKDYAGASKHTIAAVQCFTRAMQIDLDDDKPRSDALKKIAGYIEKSIKKESEIQNNIGRVALPWATPKPSGWEDDHKS
jgi:hypothetical protein